jgi:hypothetical protein
MAALDKALERAEQASSWIARRTGGGPAAAPEPQPVADADVPVIDVPAFASDPPSQPPLPPPDVM